MFKYVDKISREQYILESQKAYFSKKKLGIDVIDHGIILPVSKKNGINTSQGAGGVIDKSGKYVESSAQLAFNMIDRVNGSYDISNFDVDYIDETVVYLNFFYKHWGHFIIDIVSRLWYIQNSVNKYKVVFTTELFKNTDIDGNYLEFLNLFGIPTENIIVLNRPTKFRTVIVPEVSIFPGKYFTKEYKLIFERVASKVKEDNRLPKKLYLSRSLFSKSKLKERGENSIEQFFNNNNYVSIHPEKLSLSEQIKYYKSCNEFACLSGTLPHNLIFASDQCKVIIINKTYKINKNQELINQVKNANVTYIDCHISLLPIAYGKGPFIITLNNNLKKFAEDNNYLYQKTLSLYIRNIYNKIWYIFNYLKIYKFTIHKDKNINCWKLFKEYILK